MKSVKVYGTLEQENSSFYSIMGRYFASRDIGKELEGQLYNDKNSTWYLLYDDYDLVGFCTLFDRNDSLYLDNLYILPNYRNCGNAEFLMKFVLETSEKGIFCIASNDYALRIYKNLGFHVYGNRGKWLKLKNFKED